MSAAVWETAIPTNSPKNLFPTSQEYDCFEHMISWDVCKVEKQSKSLFIVAAERQNTNSFP